MVLSKMLMAFLLVMWSNVIPYFVYVCTMHIAHNRSAYKPVEKHQKSSEKNVQTNENIEMKKKNIWYKTIER